MDDFSAISDHAPAHTCSAPQPRSKGPLIFFLFLILFGMSTTLVTLKFFKEKKVDQEKATNPPVAKAVAAAVSVEKKITPREEAEQILKDTKVVPVQSGTDNPVDLLTSIGNALVNRDFDKVEKLIGKQALTDQNLDELKKLSNEGQFKLRTPNPVREVGELEINRRARYALELADREEGRDRIYFDLLKNEKVWQVEKITLPPTAGQSIPRALIVDSLGISDAFLLALLNQNFTLAKEFVNTKKVSDATLAGLCILFEEGSYRMRKEKPLRAMIQKDNIASFLANVEASDATQAAQFAITLKKLPGNPNWIIDELNLDQLLSDYAKRVAGGDVYYSPLIKNPAGGDTLVLYFDFDANQLSLRTERQLAIVALILKTDTNKNIHLSGHTDALGSKDYNQTLSRQRAEAVKAYLIKSGVNPPQIITAAKGLSEPRRPNVTETGADDPDGRRVNRRTEIYLDF